MFTLYNINDKIEIPKLLYTNGIRRAVHSSAAIWVAEHTHRDYIFYEQLMADGTISISGYDDGTRLSFIDKEFVIPYGYSALSVGELTNHKRIKCHCGATHEYLKPDLGNGLRSIYRNEIDNEYFFEGCDSSGWYVRTYKQLVRKPRGTRDYQWYVALCPQCYRQELERELSIEASCTRAQQTHEFFGTSVIQTIADEEATRPVTTHQAVENLHERNTARETFVNPFDASTWHPMERSTVSVSRPVVSVQPMQEEDILALGVFRHHRR